MPGPTRTHLSDLRAPPAWPSTPRQASPGSSRRCTAPSRCGPCRSDVPRPGSTRGITGFVYRSIQGSVRLIGRGIDLGLAPIVPLLPEGESTPVRDAFVSSVNGVFGDYLDRTGNPLAIEMGLRYRDRPLDLDDLPGTIDSDGDAAPGGRILLMVHGLCLNERHWRREGHDHGAALADELGYTPLYLRYNTGQHIGHNGASSQRCSRGSSRAGRGPSRSSCILGHSMGGLVARSACHYGRKAGHGWLEHLGKLVFLGTPHHGSPLERGGHRLDYVLEVSPYSAPFTRIGKARSAGTTDLRHGSITTDAHEVVPLPAGVKCYAAAGRSRPGAACSPSGWSATAWCRSTARSAATPSASARWRSRRTASGSGTAWGTSSCSVAPRCTHSCTTGCRTGASVHRRPQSAVRGEHAMAAGQVQARRRNQHRQPGDEVKGLHRRPPAFCSTRVCTLPALPRQAQCDAWQAQGMSPPITRGR